MTSLIMLKQHKNQNYVIIASLKSETMDKLINRIPGLCRLISSLQGLVLRMLVDIGLQTLRCQQAFGKLDIKRLSASVLCIA